MADAPKVLASLPSLSSLQSQLILAWQHKIGRRVIILCSVLGLIKLFHNAKEIVYRRYKRYPPGLLGLPFFGSFLTMAIFREDKFYNEILPNCGPLATYKIGNTNMLCINDINLIKAIVGHKCCSQRPAQLASLFNIANDMPHSFAVSHSFHRRQNMLDAINYVTSMDFVETQLQTLLNDHIYSTIDKNFLQKEWYCNDYMINISFNIVFGALFGTEHHLKADDVKFATVLESHKEWTRATSQAMQAEYIPIPNILGLRDRIMRILQYKFKRQLAEYYSILHIIQTTAMNDFENSENDAPITTLFETLYCQINDNIENIAEEKQLSHEQINELLKTHTNELKSDVNMLVANALEMMANVLEVGLLHLSMDNSLQNEIYEELVKYCDINDIRLARSTSNAATSSSSSNRSFSSTATSTGGAGGAYIPSVTSGMTGMTGMTNNSDITTNTNTTNLTNMTNASTKSSRFKLQWDSKEYGKCPTFQAFIHECLRIIPVLPRMFPHQMSEKCVLRYNINKDTNKCQDVVFDTVQDAEIRKMSDGKKYEYEYNIDESLFIEANTGYAMVRDDKNWINGIDKGPKEFDVNRWLRTEDGRGGSDIKGEIKYFEKNNNSIPFGTGGRSCVGEMIAMKSLRVILANLILNYKFQVPSEYEGNNKKINYKWTIINKVNPPIPLIVMKRKNKNDDPMDRYTGYDEIGKRN